MAIQKWKFDLVHSSIHFWVQHLMVSKVHGRFTQWTGTLEMDEERPTSSRVEVQIDASSVDTNDAQRDTHLKSADFLDIGNYRYIVFRSTSVARSGDKLFRLQGDLTIRGTTRPIVMDVEYGGRNKDPWGSEHAGFSAYASLDRRDFGLTWNQVLEAGGILVGERVEIDIEVEAVKSQGSVTERS